MCKADPDCPCCEDDADVCDCCSGEDAYDRMLCDHCAAAPDRERVLLDLLREVACSGVELPDGEDTRMGYIAVQVDEDVWRKVRAIK